MNAEQIEAAERALLREMREDYGVVSEHQRPGRDGSNLMNDATSCGINQPHRIQLGKMASVVSRRTLNG